MTDRTARRAAFPVFVLIALILLAFNLRAPFVAVSAVAGDLESALGMSPAAVGLLTSLPVLCFGLSAPLASAVIGRLGIERSVFACLLTLLVGIAVRSVGGIPTAMVGTVIVGLAITVGNIVAPMIIARDFPRSAAAGVTGAYTAALNVGSMLALSVSASVAAAAGWAVALALPSVLTLAEAAVCIVLVRRPDHRDRVRSARQEQSPAASGGEQQRASLGTLLRRPTTWMLTGAFSGQAFGYYGLTAWLPTLLADKEGLSHDAAGAASSIFQVCAVAGAFLTPIVINRLGPATAFAVNGALWLTMPLGLLLAPGGWALWSVFAGVAQGGGFTSVFTVVVLRTRGQRENRQLSSIVQTGGYAVASLGPVVVGGLHASTGAWAAPLLVVTGGLVMLTVLGVLAAREPRVRT